MWSKVWAMLSNFLFCKLFFVTKRVIYKWLKNCKNCTFTPKMTYVKWYNIYANGVSLWGTFFQDCGKMMMGKWTMFWYGNMVLTQWYKDIHSLLKVYDTSEIVIWKNCWITSGCIILWWVKMGDNVIMGAGSVVTKDIPSNCFAAWNPCKVIKEIQ